MNKIFLVVGQYRSLDWDYDWNFCAFAEAEKANECRNQLAAEIEKFNQTPKTGQGEWQHPLDSSAKLFYGYGGPLPEISYVVDVVDFK